MNILPQGLPLAVLLTLAACGSEPPSTPPPGPPADASQSPADLGAVDAPPLPCNGACGPGTVCEGGRCLPLDAGPPVDVPGLDTPPLPVDTSPDVGPCGACSYPNARTSCSASGVCSLVGCLAGFGDCDGRNANGCETNLHEGANCGACNNRCPSGASCVEGRCSNCTSLERWCSSVELCVRLDTSNDHCGACGVRCSSGYQRCQNGLCCEPGTGNCDGDPSNGCETSLRGAPNCGRCLVVCSGGTTCHALFAAGAGSAITGYACY